MSAFELYRDKSNKYRFRLISQNGAIILTSEGYSTKQSCLNGIESVKRNSQNESRFDRRLSSNGMNYFNLRAENNQIIGTSEMYSSKAGLENGIYAVKRNAEFAQVKDKS